MISGNSVIFLGNHRPGLYNFLLFYSIIFVFVKIKPRYYWKNGYFILLSLPRRCKTVLELKVEFEVDRMLKLKVIACDVLNREISYLASQSCCHVDVTFLHQGLHDTPHKLRDQLQQEIDKANRGFPYDYCHTASNYDFIIIGYGLCSNGIIGISSEKIPLIVPRGHDCITLLLGSKDQYEICFKNNPATYWFSAGWIERGWQPSEQKYRIMLDEYTEKYGEDNAAYLMEAEQRWITDYKNAAFIHWECLPNSDYYKKSTQESANYFGWNFLEFPGNPGLLKNLLNGVFHPAEVLTVLPGKKIAPSYDQNIITFQ
jgi:hypothetical protein